MCDEENLSRSVLTNAPSDTIELLNQNRSELAPVIRFNCPSSQISQDPNSLNTFAPENNALDNNPTHRVNGALLIDYYEINMVYALWTNGKHQDQAVFDAFFRKCPFQGEFCVFAGLSECVQIVKNFRYSQENLEWLMKALPSDVKPGFYDYLRDIRMDDIKLYALQEGSPMFPHTPVLRVCGPLGKVQLLETAFLNSLNFASLIATNAARYRLAASNEIKLSEFGARKAHGPNGALTASKYAFLGGFDSTSNVLAAKLFKIPLTGTLAHSFIMSYASLDEIKDSVIKTDNHTSVDLVKQSTFYLQQLTAEIPLFSETAVNQGELAAFIAFAIAYPTHFVAVIDTYNTLLSGLPNFCAVALCLVSIGYKPVGVRLDSGDLKYLSQEVRRVFSHCGRKYPWASDSFADMIIILSNDLTEQTLSTLNSSSFDNETMQEATTSSTDFAFVKRHQSNQTVRINGHSNDTNSTSPPCSTSTSDDPQHKSGKEIGKSKRNIIIDACGIGTHLVTCYKQPALGMVFKLVEINGRPVFKISEESDKMTIPGTKTLYRLYGKDDIAICDVMLCPNEPEPQANMPIFVRHPFSFGKRANVVPSRVEAVLKLYWSNGEMVARLPSLSDSRSFCLRSVKGIREDHTRLVNPRPYKVSLSAEMYRQTQKLLDKFLPLARLS